MGSTSNVEHCPPVTSHRTLLHSKLQFRLRWRSLSSPNLLLRFGKYVVWAHVAAGILECGTVIWIKKDRGSRRIVDHEGSQSDLMSSFIHGWHTPIETPVKSNQLEPTNRPTNRPRFEDGDLVMISNLLVLRSSYDHFPKNTTIAPRSTTLTVTTVSMPDHADDATATKVSKKCAGLSCSSECRSATSTTASRRRRLPVS